MLGVVRFESLWTGLLWVHLGDLALLATWRFVSLAARAGLC